MHLIVVAASGKSGRLVVEQALEAGHQVTAVVRTSSPYRAPDGVETIHADIVDDPAFDLPPADAVVSTLGKNSSRDRSPSCTNGTAHVIAAMRTAGIRRIAVTSASPVLRGATGEPLWFRATVRAFVRWMGRHIYSDLEQMESMIGSAGPDVDATIVRPGYLVDQPRGPYTLVPQANAMGVVHRADLAAALLDVVTAPGTVGLAYGLASRPQKNGSGR